VRRVDGPTRCVATWLRGLAVASVFLAAVSCSSDEKAPAGQSSPSTPPTSVSPTESESATAPASLDEVVAGLQATVDTQVARHALPGAIVLVRIDDDERVVAGGLSRLQPATKMRRTDTFGIASVTKPMVAAAVLRLVEAGQLSLDDSVEDWVPGLLVDGEKITIAHLLSHQSGLPESSDDGKEYDTFEQLVRAVGKQPRLFEPGEKSYYSNVNYYLVGLILEKVTGQPLADVLDEQVFGPARMTSTRLNSPPSDNGPGMVRGYEADQDVTGILGDFYAAGAVVSTARDVSRFFRQLLGGELLPPEVVADMVTPRDWLTNGGVDYGLGIVLGDARCGPMIGHTGEVPGFIIEAYTLEAEPRSAVVMVNASDPAGAQAGPLLEAALCG
jgi:D-alanyl-D-alanine carboxypeptidase